MKKTCCLLSLFLFFFYQAPAQSKKKARERVFQILQQYDRDSYALLKEYEMIPSNFTIDGARIDFGARQDFMEYIGGNSEEKIVDNLALAVHEISHSYSSRAAYQYLQDRQELKDLSQHYSLLFHTKDRKYFIPHNPTYPSREFARLVPQDLRTDRYDLYIATQLKEQSTQIEGVFGLIDEWNAYFLDTRHTCRMFKYFQNQSGGMSPENFLRFMSAFDGSYFAYAEFKYFILQYLIYARDNHPDIYQQNIQNQGLKQAFQSIDQSFLKVIQEYTVLREQQLKAFKTAGYDIDVNDEYTFVGNSGIGNFRKTYKRFIEEIQKPAFQEMQKELYK